MTDSGESATSTASEPRLLPPWLSTYLTGLAMGSADAVPGVSGGTIALIAGIYDRLVAAIAAFEPRLLADAVERRNHRPIVDLLERMDVRFLVALGLGVATGLATVARVVVYGYQELPGITYAFFFGLIAASAVVLFDEVALDRRRERVAAVVGVVLAFVIVGRFRADIGQGPLVVVVAGAISICAMILPGVSGSFVLFVLGLHEFMADKLNAFIDAVAALATGGDVGSLVEPTVFVAAYCAGAAVGILSFARVVQGALDRDRKTTITFLVALMVGSLRLPLREVHGAVTPTSRTGGVALAAVALSGIVAAGLVLALDRYTGGVTYEADEEPH